MQYISCRILTGRALERTARLYGFAMRLDARWHSFPSLGRVHGHAGCGCDLDFARIAAGRVFTEGAGKLGISFSRVGKGFERG
jgi:hypothetical protein